MKPMNVKIHKPQKDQCKICTKYNWSSPEEKEEMKDLHKVHTGNNRKVMEWKEMYKTKEKEDANLLVFSLILI